MLWVVNAYDGGVHDNGSGLHRMKIGELRRTEERRALVELELIGYVELFAKPWYALRLGVLEMVNCESHNALLNDEGML